MWPRRPFRPEEGKHDKPRPRDRERHEDSSTPQFLNRSAAKRESTFPQFLVQGRAPVPGDPVHDPILDKFSGETGLPRDQVTQHDPAYEAWLLGHPLAPAGLNITVDMSTPATNPGPDYSKDENTLNAWEKA